MPSITSRICFGIVMQFGFAAMAANPAVPREVDVPRILEIQRAIAERMADANDALGATRAHTIRTEQRRILALIEGKASIAELSREQRLQLINAQERINAAIQGTRAAEAARLVCRRQRPTGSHVARVRCATVSQDELHRDMADRDADGKLLAD
jgi:hypothetical protein